MIVRLKDEPPARAAIAPTRRGVETLTAPMVSKSRVAALRCGGISGWQWRRGCWDCEVVCVSPVRPRDGSVTRLGCTAGAVKAERALQGYLHYLGARHERARSPRQEGSTFNVPCWTLQQQLRVPTMRC